MAVQLPRSYNERAADTLKLQSCSSHPTQDFQKIILTCISNVKQTNKHQ
jgi:hypothetical protein